MAISGKVQTNDYKVNVLVEIDGGSEFIVEYSDIVKYKKENV